MRVTKASKADFLELASQLKFQNQDTIEAWQFGYKSVYDAFKRADHAWANYYLFEDDEGVYALAVEQRDGNFHFYTTVQLSGVRKVRELVEAVKRLTDDLVACKNHLMTAVGSFHKPGQKMLKLTGFRLYSRRNHLQVWVKENGK